MIKYGVKEEILFFSDDREILFFTVKELDWLNDDEYDEIDEIHQGTYYQGKLFDYDNLIDQIDDNDDAEHIDTSDEGMTIFDNLDDAKIKFKELLNSTKGINQEK